jgi:hypothetical protein
VPSARKTTPALAALPPFIKGEFPRIPPFQREHPRGFGYGGASRATARHQIIGPNLYSESKTCRRTWLEFLWASSQKTQHAL